MRKGYKQLLEEANAVVDTVQPSEAIAMLGRDDVLMVDLRDPRELEREGRMPVHSIARGACSSSGSIPKALITSPNSLQARRSSSFAPAAGGRRYRERRQSRWASKRFTIWPAGSAPGRQAAALWRL